ncbi:elongation of very long chain fatty acids protein 7-like [Macrosteles quadrilineatus]|uniref:elongation of very long chain fatty acids protein 7-like n=1 Tax=Macrosteles quadrilineatus TaxID=74068 RepID=UPI0023E32839|nr:elongation of very long chain fatty acids protein 7-like [Macrosteles quadrilineatus]XP_054287799.1 elongation of very long chain fatty acids protein 7-like [Macrosteles quadrilineatus]
MEVLSNATTAGTTLIRPEDYYQYIDKEGVIDTWLLVSTPLPVLSTIVLYLVVVLKLGPSYMRYKEPMELKRLMMFYNLFQVAYNMWMLYLVFSSSAAIRYLIDHSCHPTDPRNTFELRYVFHLTSWHYLCSKIIDLLDTCIMVLRKKQSHITYLHLYHHVAMVFFTWVSMRYIRAQQGTPPIILNNLVHVVMYTYYFLASLGPEVHKYLWWKRYLTKLQLTQFALVIAYLAYLYLNSCEVSQAFNVIWITNVSVIAAFFVNFYIQTYVIKPRRLHVKPE